LSKRAVFIDRDDTLIRDRVYLNDPEGVELIPGAAEAVRFLNSLGLPVIVISNQSGIARGLVEEENLRLIHERMCSLFKELGAIIDAIYYCPHYPGGAVEKFAYACDCRKPNPGMLIKAAEDFGLDLSTCFMVGDKPDDIEVIHRVGGKGIHVQTGKHRNLKQADFRAEDLEHAAAWIAKEVQK